MTLLPLQHFGVFLYLPIPLGFVLLLQPTLLLVHLTSPPLTRILHGRLCVYLCALVCVFAGDREGGECVKERSPLYFHCLPFLLKNMMDVLKQSEAGISVPATDVAFTSECVCVCVGVCVCAWRHRRLFDLTVLLERRLLSCFMTGAVGRYSASPASPQQSIIPLSADKRTPLILLLPLALSHTFKTFLSP